MGGGILPISTLNPPTLKSVRGDAIVKFNVEYERYTRQVEEVNAGLQEAQRVKPVGYKACVSGELLLSLVDLQTFKDISKADDVKDEHIKTWLKSRTTCSVADMPGQVKDALSRVKFKVDRQDPEGAAYAFFVDVLGELRRNRVSKVLTDSPKVIIQHLLEKLEPVQTRDAVKTAYEYWTKSEKEDFQHFHHFVIKTAVESSKYTKVTKDQKNLGSRKHDSPRGGASSSSPTAIATKTKGSEAKDDETSKKRKWKDKCLNPKCNGIHPLFRCSMTSREYAKELLAEHRAEVKRQRGLKSMRKASARGGRYRCHIPGGKTVIGLGDYGADNSALSASLIKQISSCGIDLNVTKLDNPIHLQAAFDLPPNAKFTVSSTAKMDITVSLPCGNLILRNVLFWVVDQDMNEIILGRPLLQCIGFDLDKVLTKLQADEGEIDVAQRMADGCNEINHVDPDEKFKVSSMSAYKGLWYEEKEHDPIEFPDGITSKMGTDKPEEIMAEINKTLKRATSAGMNPRNVDKCEAMMRKYMSIFRIKLGSDPPAKVDEYRVSLRENFRPFRSTQRRYAPTQKVFIEATIRSLERIGAVKYNPTARWASPALAVPKPGTNSFRFTVDLRGVNQQTVPVASAMPDLESMIRSVGDSKVFAKMDMVHAYWQIPLHLDSQECMSIQTPAGVFTPQRILQGSTDAGNHFQSVTSQIFIPISDFLLQWVDDFLLHSRDEDELVVHLEKFFKLCFDFNLKLHPGKVQLYEKSVTFCGRILDDKGVRFDPRNLAALRDMKYPTTGGELQQFMCATNWMRMGIPNYAETVGPLHKLMEECYIAVGKRTKKSVAKLKLGENWGPEHSKAFEAIRKYLQNAITLAFPKNNYKRCLFTDASDGYWAAILTQIPENQVGIKVEDQTHEPLGFLSGAFTKHSSHWSIVEKEAYAVVASMEQFHYMTAGGTVHMFTDHANLTYIFDPYGRNPGINRQVANKLMRWALKLCGHNYAIEFLSGERNVWADLLTRWAAPSSEYKAKIAVMYAPVNPSGNIEYDWPTRSDLVKCQNDSKSKRPKDYSIIDGLVLDPKKRAWIPEDDHMLKLRLLIAAHCGHAGHRAKTITTSAVAKEFHWETLEADVASFCQSCLHCLCTDSRVRVPRPLGSAIHAEKPNQVIHFDYCYIGKSAHGTKYVLIIKDDLSSYTWLYACESADAESTADALIDWFAAFGPVSQWVSDQGTHFKNELLRILKDKFRAEHHFTLPYCPWSNGTVEVVCRELLRAVRALLSEFSLPFRFWPDVLPIVQSILNTTIISRLGHRCPLTVFTGIEPITPLLHIKRSRNGKISNHSLTEIRAKQLLNVDSFLEKIDNMHKEVKLNVDRIRDKRRGNKNKGKNVLKCEFIVGDFVLKGSVQKYRQNKLSMYWNGPYKVARVLSHYLFELEDIITGKLRVAHGSRIKLFRNSSFRVTEELKEHIQYQQGQYCIVDSLLDIRVKDNVTELEVQWKGFDDEDPTWVSITQLQEDIPEHVTAFIHKLKSSGNACQRRIAKNF